MNRRTSLMHRSPHSIRFEAVLILAICVCTHLKSVQSQNKDATAAMQAAARWHYGRDNLVAWCVVPFDARQRGPEERAAMLERLGFHHYAYVWRTKHLPTFD